MHTAEEVLTFLLKYVEKHGDSFESPKAAELSGRLLEDVQPVVRDLQGAIDGVVAPVDPNGLRAAPAVSQSFNFDSDKDAGQQPQVDVHGRASD